MTSVDSIAVMSSWVFTNPHWGWGPPHQRLDSNEPAGGNLDLRLINDADLGPPQRVTQGGAQFGQQAHSALRLDGCLGHVDPCRLAQSACLCHCRGGMAGQGVEVTAVLRRQRDTGGRFEAERNRVDLEGGLEDARGPSCLRERVRFGQVWNEDRESLAGQPTHLVTPIRLLEPAGRGAENTFEDAVAEAALDALDALDVDQSDPERPWGARGHPVCGDEPPGDCDEPSTVQHPGHRFAVDLLLVVRELLRELVPGHQWECHQHPPPPGHRDEQGRHPHDRGRCDQNVRADGLGRGPGLHNTERLAHREEAEAHRKPDQCGQDELEHPITAQALASLEIGGSVEGERHHQFDGRERQDQPSGEKRAPPERKAHTPGADHCGDSLHDDRRLRAVQQEQGERETCGQRWPGRQGPPASPPRAEGGCIHEQGERGQRPETWIRMFGRDRHRRAQRPEEHSGREHGEHCPNDDRHLGPTASRHPSP
jgi:hypothetical protein